MAKTCRQSQLLTMSGTASTPDIRSRTSGIALFSSGLPPGSEVPETVGEPGLMTQPGHLGVGTANQLDPKIRFERASDTAQQRRISHTLPC
jgi:hypothetical protein